MSILVYFIFILGFIVSPVGAEYRAYQYMVSTIIPVSKNAPPSSQKSYLITTSMDPMTYLKYHGGIYKIRLIPLRTWMCPGDTSGHRPICASPYSKIGLENEKNRQRP